MPGIKRARSIRLVFIHESEHHLPGFSFRVYSCTPNPHILLIMFSIKVRRSFHPTPGDKVEFDLADAAHSGQRKFDMPCPWGAGEIVSVACSREL
jgi:hypothetical protein